MPDHDKTDWTRVTPEIARENPEYFCIGRSNDCILVSCKYCGHKDSHYTACLVPTVLELKSSIERKDRALELIISMAGNPNPSEGCRNIIKLATEALK